MRLRYRSLVFVDRWTTGERWSYSVGLLLFFVLLRRHVFPSDWPYVFLPFAAAVPVVYFLFGRGPGLLFLPVSGLAALLLTPGHDALTSRTVTAFFLYILQSGITCWLIDQLQRTEAELHRLNVDLELRVRERTADLQHTTEELESFTYSLSHDLRAPIRSINATASILLEDCKQALVPEVDAGLARIQQASHRMAQLMDAMLALSALGSPSAPRLPFSHAALVQGALDTLLPPDSPRLAQIVVHALPSNEGNPRRVQRIWENLLSNALKFTAQVAAPRIDIGFDAERKACYVRDNGVGFDMRYAEKVFKPFERLHDGTQYEGAGIGLAIAEKIVRAQGGRIWCESAPGQGSTFYFTP